MNFFFQYYDKTIDPFNNKYYRLRAYAVEDPVNNKVRELGPHEAKLVKCSVDTLKKYYPDFVADDRVGEVACF